MSPVATLKSLLQSPNQLGAVFKYLTIGIGVTLLYIGGTTLTVTVLKWPTLLCNSGFYALSTILSYLANYYWSFKSGASHGKAFAKYLSVALAGFALNALFIYGLSVVLSVPIWMSTTAFSGLWPLVSFFAQKNFVFR